MYDRDVLLNLRCQKLKYFNDIVQSSEKGLNFYMAEIISNEITNTNYIYKKDIIERLEQKDAKAMLDNEIDEFVIIINRFKDYMKDNNLKYIKDITRNVSDDGDPELIVSAKIFQNAAGDLFFVKIRNSKPDLSYKSRRGNRPEDNVQLLMLQKLINASILNIGIEDYRNVYPAMFFLKGRDDKGGKHFVFEYKEGSNIIIAHPDVGFTELAYDRLAEGMEDATEPVCKDPNMCWNCPFNTMCNNNRKDMISKEEKRPAVEGALQEKELKIKVKQNPTDQQLEAINVSEGVVRVNAGAGTGKTFVIINRIKKLIEDGADPSKLLLITFTNKGAEEMRVRLEKVGLPKHATDQVQISTFNSFGHDIIKQNYKAFGFTEEPTLIDEIDRHIIAINLLNDNKKIPGLNYNAPLMSFRYSKGAIIRVLDFFNVFKLNDVKSSDDFYNRNLDENFLLRSEQELINSGHDFVGEIFQLYIQYNSLFKKGNYIDYQDQINKIIEAIDNKNKAIENIIYHHIIVDEYQDTDAAQFKILKYLHDKEYKGDKLKSLMVVGDDSQSIFGFRGTTPEIMINFHEYFDDVKDVNITENFRSTKEIVDLANKVNTLNSTRIDKDLFSKKRGEKPALFIGDLFDVVDFSNEFNDELESVAVIARTNYELMDVKEQLDKINVDNIIDAPLIKNSNVELFNQILNFIHEGEFDAGILNLLFLYDEEFQKLNKEEQKNYFIEYKRNLIKNIPIGYTLFTIEGEMSDGNKEKFEYLDEVVEMINDTELSLFYKELREEYESVVEIKQYVNNMFLFQDRRMLESDTNYEGVVLATTHASKGREFDHVYLLIDKFKPSYNEIQYIDEEIRLLFVGITRAKKSLTIISDGTAYFLNHFKGMSDLVEIFQ